MILRWGLGLLGFSLMFGALSLPGCGGSDPVTECEEERAFYRGKPEGDCITDASLQACVACREECGDACGSVVTACPFTYSCPR